MIKIIFLQYYYGDEVKTDTYFRVKMYNGEPYVNGIKLNIGDSVKVLAKDVFLKGKYTPIRTVVGYDITLNAWVFKAFSEYDITSLYCVKV